MSSIEKGERRNTSFFKGREIFLKGVKSSTKERERGGGEERKSRMSWGGKKRKHYVYLGEEEKLDRSREGNPSREGGGKGGRREKPTFLDWGGGQSNSLRGEGGDRLYFAPREEGRSVLFITGDENNRSSEHQEREERVFSLEEEPRGRERGGGGGPSVLPRRKILKHEGEGKKEELRPRPKGGRVIYGERGARRRRGGEKSPRWKRKKKKKEKETSSTLLRKRGGRYSNWGKREERVISCLALGRTFPAVEQKLQSEGEGRGEFLIRRGGREMR